MGSIASAVSDFTATQVENSRSTDYSEPERMCAPAIPRQLALFFRCLVNGLEEDDCSYEAVNRKVTAMASDAIFNVTRGAVRPWKHMVMGLGFASLTGSKLALQILNREGHSIDYCAVKGLQTEFAHGIRSYESCSTGKKFRKIFILMNFL